MNGLVDTSSTSEAPQVHPLETTAVPEIDSTFAEWKARKYPREIIAAERLYALVQLRDNKPLVDRLLDCRKYAYFARSEETGKVRVVSNSCRLRWCPHCARAKANYIRGQVKDWILKIRRPKFLTLTIKHSNVSLEKQIDSLYRAFRLLRKHETIRKNLRGGVWFFQLKKAEKTGEWHPHLHVVLDSNFIDKTVWSVEWLRSTGTSYIIDIRAIKNPKKVSDYVARYTSRCCDISSYEDDEMLETYDVLHGRRTAGTFGTGRCISFRPRASADASLWRKLASWSSIRDRSVTDRNARAIIEAWKTNTVLPESTAEKFYSDFQWTENTGISGRLGIEDIEGKFDEFFKDHEHG